MPNPTVTLHTNHGDITLEVFADKVPKTAKNFVELAKKNDIDYRVDVYFRYGSDASVGMTQGFNANFACFGPGVDASHHYERTHLRALEESTKLLVAYLSE